MPLPQFVVPYLLHALGDRLELQHAGLGHIIEVLDPGPDAAARRLRGVFCMEIQVVQ